jgi:tetratricopeptide (TPR) repeat protein
MSSLAQLLENARTICTEGIALSSQGQREASIEKYDAVISQFGSYRQAGFAQVLATAMYNKGIAFASLERNEDAIEAYDTLINHYGNVSELAVLLIVAQTMRNKAYRLNIVERPDDSITTYENMLAQFDQHLNPEIQTVVAPVREFLAERQATLNASS